MTKLEHQLVSDAITNNWDDRIFYHYKQHIDAEAVRPQDTTSQEWLDIVAKLKVATSKVDTSAKYHVELPKEKVKPTKETNEL
jgi:hypothetical protein